MSRLRYITLAGKKYALNFSAKATKEVVKKYGDLEKVSDAFSGRPVDEVLDELLWLLELLINQGAAYKEIIEGEPGERISFDQLEVIIGFDDVAGLKTDLFGAMTAGLTQTVEVESPKNAETTQGE